MNSKSKYNSLSVAVLASLIVLGSPAQAQWTSSVGTGATLEETVTSSEMDKTFTSNDSGDVYDASANLGTLNNSLSIVGQAADDEISTINLQNHSGISVTNTGSELSIENVQSIIERPKVYQILDGTSSDYNYTVTKADGTVEYKKIDIIAENIGISDNITWSDTTSDSSIVVNYPHGSQTLYYTIDESKYVAKPTTRINGPTSDIGSSAGSYLFKGLSTTLNGGAIDKTANNNVNIYADFISNSATSEGGAIYNYNRGTITTINGDFISNSASNYGGAIFNSFGAKIDTINGDFISNSASNSGGAIYNDLGGTIDTINGDFISNSASNYGGAILNSGTITSIVGDFISNSATTTNDSTGAFGGAIFNKGGNITIDATTRDILFSGNYTNAKYDKITDLQSLLNYVRVSTIDEVATKWGYSSVEAMLHAMEFNSVDELLLGMNYYQVDKISDERDYNAIWGDVKSVITLKTGDSHTITFDDSIRGIKGHKLILTGDDTGEVVFNNVIKGNAIVTIENTDVTMTQNSSHIVADDYSELQSLTVKSGSLDISDSAEIKISENLTNQGTTINNGKIHVNTIENSGSFTSIADGIKSFTPDAIVEITNTKKVTLGKGELTTKVTQTSGTDVEFNIADLSNNDTKVILADGSNITTGKVTVGNQPTGATTIDSILEVTGVNTKFNPTEFVLNSDAKLDIKGGEVTLNGGSDLSKVVWNGTVVLDGDNASLILDNIVDITRVDDPSVTTSWNKKGLLVAEKGNLTINASTVLLGAGDIINDEVKLTLKDNGSLSISDNAQVELNNGDSIDGTINLLENGKLTLDNFATNSSSKINAENGELTISGNGLTLGNDNDSIAKDVTTSIGAGSTLAINDGEVTLNSSGTGADTWNGNVSVGGGSLTLDNINKTVSATSKYNQTSGKTELTNNSALTLSDSDSSITGGEVVLNNATLNINNGADNSAKVTITTGDNNSLNITGAYTTLTTSNDTNITKGSIVVGDDTNNSKLVVSTGSNISNSATIEVKQNAILESASNYIKTSVDNDGQYNLTNGIIANEITGDGSLTLIGNGNVANADITQNNVTLENSTDKLINNNTLTVNNTFTNKGTITGNTGTLNINGGENAGSIIQETISNSGTLDNMAGTITGDITNNGSISSKLNGLIGTVTNNGTISYNDSGSTIQDITGNGRVELDSISTIMLNNTLGNNTLALNSGNLVFGSNKTVTGFEANGGNILAQDGVISTYNLGDVTINGTTGLTLDFSLNDFSTDKFINSGVTNNGGSFNITSVNVQGMTTKDYIHVNLGDTTLLGQSNVTSDNITLPSVLTPIRRLKGDITDGWLTYQPSGSGANDFNPAVLPSSVNTQVGAYIAMTETFNYAFRHADYSFMSLPKRLRTSMANRYAITEGQSMPYTTDYSRQAGMWFQPYASFEKVGLLHGPNTEVQSYGSLVGGDSSYRELGHGWGTVTTPYIGYNGTSQHYSGVSTYTNGGILGVTQTFYKNDFFTALTINSGASVGEANTMFGHENFTSIMAGIASKTGYNFELANGKFIIQPSLMMAYSFIKTFDYTNAAGVRIDSDPLHSIQFHPTLKFMGNVGRGWQPYASVGMVWNVLNDTKVRANDIRLPEMSIRPYVEYGVGLQKTWNDRCAGFLQAMLRNGGRNGVALSFGFKWALGKEGKPIEKVQAPIGKDNNVASTSKKRVIKTNNNNLSSNNNSGLKLNVMSQNDMAKKAKATTTNSTTTKVVLKQLPLTQKMANQKGQKKVVFYAQY